MSEKMQQETSNISPIANCQSPIANGQCTERARLPWLDFASGVMILWMIVYHAISTAWGYELHDLWGITDVSLLPAGVHAFIGIEGKLEVLNPCLVFPWLYFFMPWFFYKSGQFFTKQSVKELWQKDTHKLLKTFVIWSAVGYVFYLLIGWLCDTITIRNATYSVIRGLFLTGKVPINTPLWFLLTLFGVRMVANRFLPERDDKYASWKIISMVAIGYVISYLAYRFNHRLLPYWVANGAAGLSFFTLGYALRDWEQKWWLIALSVLVYIVGCVWGFPVVDMWPNKLVAGQYLLWIPVSLCCIITFNAVCRWITCLIQVKQMEWVGKNAMTIYVVHCMVYVTVSTIFEYYDVQIATGWLFGVILLAYALILPIVCKLQERCH